MDEGLVNILLALISLLGTIIVAVLVPYVRSKTTKEQRDKVEYWTDKAVKAMEIFYEGNPKQGPIKKETVIEFIVEMGIKIPEKQLSVLIDAIVKEMNDAKEKLLE